MFDLSQREGFWREYGFGMVSLYQSDFASSGGFDMNLHGWGMEDVHLVTNFIMRGKVNLFNKNVTFAYFIESKRRSFVPGLISGQSPIASQNGFHQFSFKCHAEDN